MKGPNIAFFLQQRQDHSNRPRISPLTAQIVERLQSRGARVDLIVPETNVIHPEDIRPLHDLYVLKDNMPLHLSLAGALALAGARIVNSARSCLLARDKIAATALVAAAGVAVPPSWATGNPRAFRAVAEYGPLWLKAPHGSGGVGVRRIADPYALEEQQPVDQYGLPLALFAQREVLGDGQDLKVYVVGENVWALRRPFPAVTLEQKMGKEVSIAPAIRETALACGRALGLELYGVDFLVSGDQFYLVDVNAFPGYKGINEAPQAIAEHLYHKARPIPHSCAGEKMTL